jgi:hypothetical protein
MKADDPIRRETQVFVWMLCLSDTTFTAYCDMAPYRARLEQLRETYQAQRRGSH